VQNQKIGMGRRTEIITEYRLAGRDADWDGDNIVGIGWERGQWKWGGDGNKVVGMGTKYFTLSSSSLNVWCACVRYTVDCG